MKRRTRPRTSAEVDQMFRDGTIDAAVQRAVREAIAKNARTPRVRRRRLPTPKTSEEVAEMLGTGKIIDAAVARATRKAAAEARRSKPAPRTSRSGAKRAA